MPRVLITDYVHPILITGLRDLGYFVHYIPEIEREQVLDWIHNCAGIVINTKTVADADLIVAAQALKWIARLGSGLDIIDLHAAQSRGIIVISTPQANANAVAEHVFGMLLCLMRNIAIADGEVRQGLWNREKNRGRELRGKTVGVIGFGHTGSAFASKFEGWDVRVMAYDKYKTHYTGNSFFIHESTLQEVLSSSDIISLHLPLTAETRQMVDPSFLSRCKPGAILLNSSRGKVLNTAALLEALQSGHVSGACLDVFENEKPDTYSRAEKVLYKTLASMDNVILTPHVAGWTFESKRRIAEQVVLEVGKVGETGEAG